jgi:hypothetical protein
MNDLHQVESMLAEISSLGRIIVSGRTFAFALHDPSIRPVEYGDFQVAGLRRRGSGDARSWQPHGVIVTKVLHTGNGRLIIQDTRGQVLTLTAPGAGGSYSESEQAE